MNELKVKPADCPVAECGRERYNTPLGYSVLIYIFTTHHMRALIFF